jgi:hypothetical protein
MALLKPNGNTGWHDCFIVLKNFEDSSPRVGFFLIFVELSLSLSSRVCDLCVLVSLTFFKKIHLGCS